MTGHPAGRMGLSAVLGGLLLVACSSANAPESTPAAVTVAQARSAFCGRTATPTQATKAGFESDATLFAQAGDQATAASIRTALGQFPTLAANDVSVFLDRITQAEREALQTKLEGIVGPSNVSFETREQAVERFKELFKDAPDLIANLDPSALPESFRVHATSEAESIQVKSAAGSSPGVDKVVAQVASLADAEGLQQIVRLQQGVCGSVPSS